MQMLDTDKKAYGWLLLMASCSEGRIGALCDERFCERILSEAKNACHKGNTLFDTEEMNILVVLCMNRECIQHTREICPKLSGQTFNRI